MRNFAEMSRWDRIVFIGCIVVACLIYVTYLEAQQEKAELLADVADTCRPLDIEYDSLQPDSNFRDLYHDSFGVGEHLTFELGYGFLKAGTSTLQVDSLFEHNGRLCYMISSNAKSYKFFDSFYKVRDHGETWIDAYGLFTWRFEKHLREGGFKADVVQIFDQYRDIVYEEEDTTMIETYAQDVLSSLYYVRTLDLHVGDTIAILNYSDRKCYDLDVIVHKREEIEVEAGKFTCLKVEPLLKSAGLFKHEGELAVWLTDDRLKMPVLMKSKVLVGSITAELIDFRIGELLD